jgi:hypothetical protein
MVLRDLHTSGCRVCIADWGHEISNSPSRRGGGLTPGIDVRPGVRQPIVVRATRTAVSLWLRVPVRIPPLAIAIFGILTAAGVGYVTSQNPAAQPAGLGVLLRVLIIGTVSLTAVYAQTSVLQEWMGLLLCGACVFSSLWLLNGSGSRFWFSLGALFSGPALVVAYYLMLAHPRGTLRPGWESRYVALLGSATVVLWTVATVASTQPPLRTPLLTCSPHCPRNSFFLGSGIDQALPVLRIVLRVIWASFTVGAIVFLGRRWRSASGPLRRSRLAVWIVSCLAGGLLLGYLIAERPDADRLSSVFGTGYVAMWAIVPVAILGGLVAERLFMGQAVARFIQRTRRRRRD